MGRPPIHNPLNQQRACLNCQKRKSRCQPNANGFGPCSYCDRAGKDCSFVNPPDRTRLTRANLDALERRCNQLQALVRSLHPDLDIDVAIANLEAGRDISKSVGPASNHGSPEAEEPAHEFEWNEASLHLTLEAPNGDPGILDGMATLNSLDAGYLGSSSGANLLQEIASMLPELSAASSPVTSHGKSSSNKREPKVVLDLSTLANSAMTNYLIDAYFLFYNVSYPILHERSFRMKAASRGVKRGTSSWNVVYFLVLAIGHWVSTSDAHHAVSKFYNEARNSLSIHMLETGTLETVQALLLMGNYLQKMDKPNTGYQFIGIAYKMALGLGMHRESPTLDENIGHERRRQLYWVVYCFDSGFNITTGRPPYAQEGTIDTRLPKNIDDKDLKITMPVPQEVDTPTVFSAIIAQAQLAQIANSLYLEYLTAKTANTKVEYQVADAFDRRLAAWRHNLPAYFTSDDVPMWFAGPRAVVLWKEQNLRIILWRGSKRNHPFLADRVDAETRCLDVAMQSIHDIITFCTAKEAMLHLGIIWYAAYFLFQAALVLEASYLNQETQNSHSEEMKSWREMVLNAQKCLTTFADKSRSAKRCLGVLDLINKRTETSGYITVPKILQEQENAQSQTKNASMGRLDPSTSQDAGDNFDFSLDPWILNDDGSDPTMRMILDNTPWGYLDNAPMDVLFNDWFQPDVFNA